ncbi:MAG: type II toxin-antitoxin system PemK/MazF family toxin [Candidatus Krumholzibacteria bacterium]|nr:type II toxin-antitoxin system PemK/MazF family toxin [Candidatus Krumholzibacteria bacterium]
MLRGEIWWASLPVPRGSEPGYRRPVVIVQSNAFNRSEISTIVVAAISSNLRLAEAPGNIFLKRRESKLPKDSVINVSQLLTLDKKYLTEKTGQLSSRHMLELEEGLKMVLSLG